jgi:O-antigen ligase
MRVLANKPIDFLVKWHVPLLVFLGVSSTLVIKGGYTYWCLFLSILGLYHVARNPRFLLSTLRREDMDGSFAWLLGCFFLSSILSIFIYAFHGYSIGGFQSVLPFLVYPFFISIISKENFLTPIFLCGSATAALGATFFALIQIFYLGEARAFGHINPITFGDTCLIFSTACIIGFIELGVPGKVDRFKIILFVGGLSGLIGSILSGSKGGWLSLITIYTYWIWRSTSKAATKKRYLLPVAIVFITLVFYFLIPDHIVKNRIASGWNGLITYLETGEVTEGSVSIRLELWKVGIRIFLESPLVGSGDFYTHLRRIELAQSGEYPQMVADIRTFDNEYVNRLAAEGLIGLASTLLIFAGPLLAFNKFRKSSIDTVRALALIGMALPVLYFEFGLSVSIYGTNAFRQVYASWSILLLSLIAAELRIHRKPSISGST